MKDLNNIVVENLDEHFAIEMIKAYHDLGIVSDNVGIYTKKDNNRLRYYGVIDGHFSFWSYEDVHNSNAKIITLEQLKAMKEDKSEYPKLMYVGSIEPHLALKVKKEVFFKDEYGYWCRDIDDKEKSFCFKFAQDIEEEKPQVEPIKITTPFEIVENYIIILNGVEYVPKNNQ